MNTPTTDMLAELTARGFPTADLAVADGAHLAIVDPYEGGDVRIHADAACDEGAEAVQRGWTVRASERRILSCHRCTDEWALWGDVETFLVNHHNIDGELGLAGRLLSCDRISGAGAALTRAFLHLEGLDHTRWRPEISDQRHAPWITANESRLRQEYASLRERYRTRCARAMRNPQYVLIANTQRAATTGSIDELSWPVLQGNVVHIERRTGHHQPWVVLAVPDSVRKDPLLNALRGKAHLRDLGPANDCDDILTWATFAALYSQPAGKSTANLTRLLDTARTVAT